MSRPLPLAHEEGAGAANAGPQSQTLTTQPLHSAGDPALVKRQATVAAKLALAGFTMLGTRCGKFIVARWDHTCEFAELEGVEQFVRELGQ